MREVIIRYLNEQLPAYANGSLRGPLRGLVRLWLRARPQATRALEGLQHLQGAIGVEAASQPAAAAWQRIRERIQVRTAPGRMHSKIRAQLWGLTALVLVITAAFLWNILPPGIVLEWSFDGFTPEEFRVYRAAENPDGNLDTLDYSIIEEVPFDGGLKAYRFTDLRLVPGQTYVYRVEAVDPNGFLLASDFVAADAFQALPGQAALVLAGLGIILALVLLLRQAGFVQHGLISGNLLIR